MVSCSKSEEIIAPQNNLPILAKAESGTENHSMYELMIDLDGEICCPIEGGNCIGVDIIITPDNGDNDDILAVISNVKSGDSAITSHSFTDNYDILTRYIKPHYINGVIEGKISVTSHENQKNNLKFFFFENKSNGKKMAYELKFVR